MPTDQPILGVDHNGHPIARNAIQPGARFPAADFAAWMHESRAFAQWVSTGVPPVRTDLRGLDLTDCDFDQARLVAVDLHGATLSGANLAGAHLQDAVLVNATLAGAVLSHAELDGADFEGADLIDADLRHCDLRAVRNLTLDQVMGARVDITTVLPPDIAHGLAQYHGLRTAMRQTIGVQTGPILERVSPEAKR